MKDISIFKQLFDERYEFWCVWMQFYEIDGVYKFEVISELYLQY